MWIEGSTYSLPQHWREVVWLVVRKALGNAQVLTLQEAQWAPGTFWSGTRLKYFPPVYCPDHRARSHAIYHLMHLARDKNNGISN